MPPNEFSTVWLMSIRCSAVRQYVKARRTGITGESLRRRMPSEMDERSCIAQR